MFLRATNISVPGAMCHGMQSVLVTREGRGEVPAWVRRGGGCVEEPLFFQPVFGVCPALFQPFLSPVSGKVSVRRPRGATPGGHPAPAPAISSRALPGRVLPLLAPHQLLSTGPVWRSQRPPHPNACDPPPSTNQGDACSRVLAALPSARRSCPPALPAPTAPSHWPSPP